MRLDHSLVGFIAIATAVTSCALFETRPAGKILSCRNQSLANTSCPVAIANNPMAISLFDRPDGNRIAEVVDDGGGIPYIFLGDIVDDWIEVEFLDGEKGYLDYREEFAIQAPTGGDSNSLFWDGRI